MSSASNFRLRRSRGLTLDKLIFDLNYARSFSTNEMPKMPTLLCAREMLLPPQELEKILASVAHVERISPPYLTLYLAHLRLSTYLRDMPPELEAAVEFLDYVTYEIKEHAATHAERELRLAFDSLPAAVAAYEGHLEGGVAGVIAAADAFVEFSSASELLSTEELEESLVSFHANMMLAPAVSS